MCEEVITGRELHIKSGNHKLVFLSAHLIFTLSFELIFFFLIVYLLKCDMMENHDPFALFH